MCLQCGKIFKNINVFQSLISYLFSILFSLWRYLFGFSHTCNVEHAISLYKAVRGNIRVPRHISDKLGGTSTRTTQKIMLAWTSSLHAGPISYAGIICPTLWKAYEQLTMLKAQHVTLTYSLLHTAWQRDLCLK